MSLTPAPFHLHALHCRSKTLMTQARLDLESQSDAAVHAATEAVLAAESAAAGANAARMGVADELLREQQAQEAQVLA